ncbi:MAG: serine hydrolase [Bacteroidetes bacterium]|nr:serine hydrolase [Bacteroidota bacterium]MBI3482604.1 serine hydrolase [Bacteroidota bacterium]
MKIFKRTLLTILLIIIVYAAQYAWRALPILSGYGAKDICSCVFIAGRDPKNVIENELNSTPLKYGSFAVDYKDSSSTGSVFGLAKRKAVFRKGLGCTLIVEMSEDGLRNQKMNLYRRQKINTDSIAWPQGDKLPDTISEKINKEKLQTAISNAFVETDTIKAKQKRTRAVVVLYDGILVGEKYATGFDRNSKQIGWSMTKSITNALVGILVRQGKLKLEDPTPVVAWKNDVRKNITLADMMHMSSGLKWEENYGGPSGATNMLFKKKDMGVYAAESKLESKPGEVFEYSSGTTNIISRIVREKVGDENYYQFPYKELFSKIGMHSIVLEPDAGGTFVGSSYSFATARDFARFGLLYSNDGIWNGERILPEGWVKFSFTPPVGAKQGQYGAQWWTNAGEKNNPSNRPYPDVPVDAYLAEGFEGQNIFIVPSKKLVVVRLGLTKTDFDMNKFVSEIIRSLE